MMGSKLTPEQKAFLLKQKEIIKKLPKPRPIWRMAEIDESKEYVLLLLENQEGLRDFELREYTKKSEEVLGTECKYTTEKIPFDLVFSRNLNKISDSVLLESGGQFCFDSLGRWMTEDERAKFEKEVIARSKGSN